MIIKKNRHSDDRLRSPSGQALTEYVLLTAIVAGLLTLLFALMPRALDALERPLKKDFKFAYKFGDPKACGFDDDGPPCTGSPARHPRYHVPDNFRLFGRGPSK